MTQDKEYKNGFFFLVKIILSNKKFYHLTRVPKDGEGGFLGNFTITCVKFSHIGILYFCQLLVLSHLILSSSYSLSCQLKGLFRRTW